MGGAQVGDREAEPGAGEPGAGDGDGAPGGADDGPGGGGQGGGGQGHGRRAGRVGVGAAGRWDCLRLDHRPAGRGRPAAPDVRRAGRGGLAGGDPPGQVGELRRRTHDRGELAHLARRTHPGVHADPGHEVGAGQQAGQLAAEHVGVEVQASRVPGRAVRAALDVDPPGDGPGDHTGGRRERPLRAVEAVVGGAVGVPAAAVTRVARPRLAPARAGAAGVRGQHVDLRRPPGPGDSPLLPLPGEVGVEVGERSTVDPDDAERRVGWQRGTCLRRTDVGADRGRCHSGHRGGEQRGGGKHGGQDGGQASHAPTLRAPVAAAVSPGRG